MEVSVTAEEAKALALQFIETERRDHARLHGVEPYEYVYCRVDPDPSDNGQWCAVFAVKTDHDHFLDGPVFVIIDDATGRVNFLEEL